MSDLDIASKVKQLPDQPGIYLMKNSSNQIIYVGKAKILKNRVSSYFVKSKSHTDKTQALTREIASFDVILTSTEAEALLLERSMIRHHQPHFNILLRDDKEYPYVRVNFQEDWPRIEKVRRRKDDGADYIGPFSQSSFLSISLKTISRVFPLIRCTPHEFAQAKRPCNYYHMKMCLAPCTLPVSSEQYKDMIRSALRLFKGQHRELQKELELKMQDASEHQRYELAASLRDQISALKVLNEKQSVIIRDLDEGDAIGIVQKEEWASIQVLMIREGQLLGSESFMISTPIQTEKETLSSFLFQYYENRLLPKELLLPFALEDIEAILANLGTEDQKKRCRWSVPERGNKADLIKLAHKNAQYSWDEQSLAKKQQRVDLSLIKNFLNLKVEPNRSECIDISNIQGTAIVGSNICFIQGKPRKDLYRIYSIRSVTDGPDDFGSIREVVRRRLIRGVRDHDLPDLLLIDGGRGQLSSALEVLREFPAIPTAIVSIAKSRGKEDTPDERPEYSDERIFVALDQAPIPLTIGSPEFRFFTQMRDEAHRFAIKHHRQKRSKIAVSSELDHIPGIGKTLRKRMIQDFGGMEGLRKASLDQIKKIKGMRAEVALLVYTKLRSE